MASKDAQQADDADRPYGIELGIEMVDVFVGPSKTLFRVHKARLCSKVSYFDKMFNGGFVEAREQLAQLPEDDCDAFNLFLEWLYTGQLRVLDIRKHDLYKYDEPEKTPYFQRVKLYCFAEKYCISELMDFTMTDILHNYRKHKKHPMENVVGYTYKHTSSGSPLRRYMSRCLLHVTTNYDDDARLWPTNAICKQLMEDEDLILDVFTLLRKSDVQLKNPWDFVPCDFHVHEIPGNCLAK